MARLACLRLLAHCDFLAASRAICTAGSNNAIKMPMIVITTSNSTNVKPGVSELRFMSSSENNRESGQ